VAGTGSAGYVPYWTSSTNIGSDQTSGGQFFWDSTNHRLGIGTTVPTTTLDVFSGGDNTNVKFEGSTGKLAIWPYYNYGGNLYGALLESFNAAENAYEPMTLLGSTIMLEGGNVGIGTTNPGALLTVGNNAFEVNASGNVTAGTWQGTPISKAYGGWTQGATLQATPSNPTGTTSATGVMMGLGSTCKITPTFSGRVHVQFYGQMTNSVGGSAYACTTTYYGSGSAPSNGAASTGTAVGTGPCAYTTVPYVNGGIVTGLTLNAAYWFDQKVQSSTGSSTASIAAVTCEAFEF
jgi:hypothetical protein